MYQGLFSALYVLLFYLTFTVSRELSLLIVRPNTDDIHLQMNKQRLEKLNYFSKVSQQVSGRTGLWTQGCVILELTLFTTVQPITLTIISRHVYLKPRQADLSFQIWLLLSPPPALQVIGGFHCVSNISSNSVWPSYTRRTLPLPSLSRTLCPKSTSRQRHCGLWRRI